MPLMALRVRPMARCLSLFLIGVFAAAAPAQAAKLEYDHAKYMAPDELRPGMKGYGKTVISGTAIEKFDVEVIGVMTNAYYAKQDVILVRCKGLNLEHSGIVAGMSGSPCYIRDDEGHERMIGAVAYGWTFNKDPICGVQPITQMLDVANTRNPDHRPKDGATVVSRKQADEHAGGVDIGQLIARVWGKPIDKSSCFSVFNNDIATYTASKPAAASSLAPGLEPLKIPVMIGGARPEVLDFFKGVLDRFSMEPVAAGGATATTRAESLDVKLEPGSVLCIPLVTGDISMDALGTCTEVFGDRVLGFGHAMDGQGWTHLPLATGMVHTIVPSVMRSNKLGASLKPVGTLWGDESSGIFGMVGKTPPTIPVDVTVEDIRGKTDYHFNVASEEMLTPGLLAGSVMEAIYAHSEMPREHTLRYSLETEFGDAGWYRTSNFTSQSGAGGLGMAMIIPAMTVLNSPFGHAQITRAKVNVKIESDAHYAEINQVVLDRHIYKPGDTVNARVRWAHWRGSSLFTDDTYSLKLPDDLDDGEYQLTVTSGRGNLLATRVEKPHLFRAESLPELVERANFIASSPDNRLFLRMTLPRGGVAVKSTELPDLPSYRAQIYAESKRADIQPYREALVKSYDLPFAVEGGQTLGFTVSKRADQ